MDIKRYISKRRAIGVNDRTIKNITDTLNQFFDWKGSREITEDLILEYLEYLQNYTYGKNKKKYSPLTIYQHKSILKTYLDSEYPNVDNHIKLKMPKRKLPNALLTEDDIEKLLSVCLHPRDLALISFLYESGCRKGELLSLKNNNVNFDEYGAIVTFPEGKTGSRRIRVIYSASYLRAWKEVHPRKENDEAFFFCSLRTPDLAFSMSGLQNQLKDLGVRAGIKKKIYPHLFRHSAATRLAKKMTEQEMKTYLGWTPGSGMASTYVHLAGEDIDDTVLRIYGVETKKKNKETLTVVKCPRCKDLNPVTASYCNKCGMPLQESTRDRIEKASMEIETEVIKAALINPAILQELAARIEALQNNKN